MFESEDPLIKFKEIVLNTNQNYNRSKKI